MSNRSPAPSDTKKRILDAAEAILLEQGFSGTGINDILKAVGVPKGSFYHWFPSKEQFGVELLQHYAAKALASKRKWMSKRDLLPNAAERIITGIEAGISCLLESDCKQGCLILKLSNEVSSWSEPMRAALNTYFIELVAIYQTVIEEGQAQGSITTKRPAAHLANVVHDLWLGAYTRALALRSVEPIRQSVICLNAYLAP
jgi:TetR/AcrR family transcriptional regulator, transcriptional repressor for nem operon